MRLHWSDTGRLWQSRSGSPHDYPADFAVQRDLALSLNRVADSLLAAAKTEEALALYERSRLIREALLEAAGEGDERRGDRVASLARPCGELREDRGHPARRREMRDRRFCSIERSVELRRQLVELEPDNTQIPPGPGRWVSRGWAPWRFALLNYEGALRYFEEAQRSHHDLTRLDPDRLDWKFDLSVSEENVGDAWLALDEPVEAMPPLEAALAIRSDLVRADSENLDWKRSLPASRERSATLQELQAGDRVGAL